MRTQREAPSSGPRVLYVMGWGRSGSTILGSVLGQVRGLFHVGELCNAWERGFLEDWRCGCGSAFSRCPTWTAIRRAAFPDGPPPAAELARRAESVRTRHLPLLAWSGGRRRLRERLGPCLDQVAALYRAALDESGAVALVDTSKIPAHAYLLSLVPGVELHVVHLVRDARAVAYSWWRRSRVEGVPRDLVLAPHSPFVSAMRWNHWNVAAELFGRLRAERHVLLRYEDFVAQPRRTVARLVEPLGVDPDDGLVFDGERTVVLRPSHAFSGNPARFRSGPVELLCDAEWSRDMAVGERRLVTALTWPLLGRYGYLRRAPGGAAPLAQ